MTDDPKRAAALQALAEATAVVEARKRDLRQRMDELLAVHGRRLVDRIDFYRLGDPKATAVGACREAAKALDRALEHRASAHAAVFGWCGWPEDSHARLCLSPAFRSIDSAQAVKGDWLSGKAWVDERDGRIVTCADSLILWAEGVRTLELQHGDPSRSCGVTSYHSVTVRLRDTPPLMQAMERALAGVAPVQVVLPPPRSEAAQPERAPGDPAAETGGRISRLELD